MLEEPTSLRIEDPGVRALFSEAARFQSWLDVEAALADAQAELGIIPAAAREIVAKAQLKYLDLAAVRAGLARTGQLSRCGPGHQDAIVVVHVAAAAARYLLAGVDDGT